jgi:hypothetical protein
VDVNLATPATGIPDPAFFHTLASAGFNVAEITASTHLGRT